MRALQPGRWPTNVDARVVLTDGLGARQSIQFPVPVIEVPSPTVVPTPVPSETSEPTPTLASVTDVPPLTLEIYLPLALREECQHGQVSVDVALVIDASSSMSAPSAPGRGKTKLAAAIAAAGAFLDLLALDVRDQAAILSFNRDAWLHSELTSDRGRLNAALAEVRLGQQTRLDRAVDEGAKALQDTTLQDPGNASVLIVLTDGRANPVPVENAIDRAREVKGEGITIFTIGLGTDLETAALRDIASTDAHYFHAPSSDDLADIYGQVAQKLPCPAHLYWGER